MTDGFLIQLVSQPQAVLSELPLTCTCEEAVPLVPADPCAAFNNTVELYRASNGALHDHFYTTSLAELVSAAPAYVREQSGARVLATNATGAVPLFRLWNPDVADHFFTTSAYERAYVLDGTGRASIGRGGWADEGVAAYVLDAPRCGTVPLYRLFRWPQYDHFYTTDAVEMVRSVTQDGYTFESVIGYVWPS